MKSMQATLAATVWGAAAVAAVGCPAPAYADPPVGGCDPEALTVTAGRMQSGLGHRAIQLNFTLDPNHDAHATLEWVGNVPRPDCSTYEGPRTDARLQVTPPGMSQTLTVPISIGRNEGLCDLEVHPLTA
jgi:hypothetical protein